MKTTHALCIAAGILLLSACGPAATPAAPAAKATPTAALPEPASRDAAMTCIQNNNLECAEANLRGYLKQYPNDSESAAVLGITLTRAGKHREALPFYASAVKAGESTYDLFAGYARSLDASGDLANAITYNRKALQIVPQLVDVRGDLARELVQTGKAQEALDLLREFDKELQAKGQPAYFTVQIQDIEARMRQ